MELKDYIFVTGASGIGKTTLANGLLAHYKTTCIEQNIYVKPPKVLFYSWVFANGLR